MELAAILRIGWRLQYLKRAPTLKQNVKGEGYILENLEVIQKHLDDIKLNGGVKDQISKIIKKLDKYEIEEKINQADAEYLKNKSDTLFELIDSELRNIVNFQVIEECCLDKGNLIKLMNLENSVFFDEAIWNQISEIGKSDFSDAAKCLLIGAPTPATMITMRATEEILKEYYAHKTGNDPGKKTWGKMTDDLKKIPFINIGLIGHLDYLRSTRRNIAQHPNKTFTQRESERIFMEIIPTIHDIFEDMI